MSTLEENYDHILENIEKAKQRVGRVSDVVRVMAVTKTRGIDIVESAYKAGFRLFGENRIQEATEKFSDFHKDTELHIIGHLQSNKVKKAVEISSTVEKNSFSSTNPLLEASPEVLYSRYTSIVLENSEQNLFSIVAILSLSTD